MRVPNKTPAQKAKMRQLWDEGLTAAEIGERVGLSKNAVIGIGYRAGWPLRHASASKASQPTTVFDRCDALDAKLDAVLAATADVPRVPPILAAPRR